MLPEAVKLAKAERNEKPAKRPVRLAAASEPFVWLTRSVFTAYPPH
jgi:hypothetical protein